MLQYPTLARKPRWLTQTLQDAREEVGTTKMYFRVSYPLKEISNYDAWCSSIVDAKPSSYDETMDKQVW